MKTKIFVVGGLDGQNAALRSGEVYEPSTNAWNFIASVNQPRRDFGLGVIQGMMFVFGGGGTNTIECYDSNADEWKIVGKSGYEVEYFPFVCCALYLRSRVLVACSLRTTANRTVEVIEINSFHLNSHGWDFTFRTRS